MHNLSIIVWCVHAYVMSVLSPKPIHLNNASFFDFIMGHIVFSASMSCRSGEEFMKVDNLLLGSIFKILLSCDLISNMAGMDVGVVWAVWHCTM